MSDIWQQAHPWLESLVAYDPGKPIEETARELGLEPGDIIKVASNDHLFASMPDDMDVNCGDILSAGVSLEDKGAGILETILRVASGEKTKSEDLGLGDNEFIPWHIGAVM